MNRDTAVSVPLRGHVVHGIRVVLVLLGVEVTVVDGERPKCVDGDVLDGEFIWRCAVVLGRSFEEE